MEDNKRAGVARSLKMAFVLGLWSRGSRSAAAAARKAIACGMWVILILLGMVAVGASMMAVSVVMSGSIFIIPLIDRLIFGGEITPVVEIMAWASIGINAMSIPAMLACRGWSRARSEAELPPEIRARIESQPWPWLQENMRAWHVCARDLEKWVFGAYDIPFDQARHPRVAGRIVLVLCSAPIGVSLLAFSLTPFAIVSMAIWAGGGVLEAGRGVRALLREPSASGQAAIQPAALASMPGEATETGGYWRSKMAAWARGKFLEIAREGAESKPYARSQRAALAFRIRRAEPGGKKKRL